MESVARISEFDIHVLFRIAPCSNV